MYIIVRTNIAAIIIFPLLITTATYTIEQAVICVPVADLVGQPIAKLFPHNSIVDIYNTIPFFAEKNNLNYLCVRLHQLLYNDTVNVLEKTDNEVRIEIPHAFYITSQSLKPQSTYWTLKKNICFIEDIHNKNRIYIPTTLSYHNHENMQSYNNTIITLTMPHYDPLTNITFSAGTRFVGDRYDKHNNTNMIKIFYIHYNNNNNKIIGTYIPTNKCIQSSELDSPEKKINHYIKLLQKWTHLHKEYIPYTWGGTSFIKAVEGPFTKIIKETSHGPCALYTYEKYPYATKSGFDCSGVILRAAQISNIPYFCKNTTTIDHSLKTLEPLDSIINGDLILIKGHVMVISDIARNMLIEARCYGSGYGKLHEIPLKEIFHTIETYQDLRDAYFNKKPLQLKNKTGNVYKTATNWKILKIMSIFD